MRRELNRGLYHERTAALFPKVQAALRSVRASRAGCHGQISSFWKLHLICARYWGVEGGWAEPCHQADLWQRFCSALVRCRRQQRRKPWGSPNRAIAFARGRSVKPESGMQSRVGVATLAGGVPICKEAERRNREDLPSRAGGELFGKYNR